MFSLQKPENRVQRSPKAKAGGEFPASLKKHPNSNPLWSQMATSATIQKKPTVSAPGDEYEQEADVVADQVMRMPADGEQEELQEEAPSIQTKPLNGSPSSLQRMCAECEEGVNDEESPAVQTKSNGAPGQGGLSASVRNTIDSPGSGSPLNGSVRSRVEPVLGADLSNVRVHNGAAAQEASQSLDAKAFTHQNNIYLGRGQSAGDVPLMAHEATHVVQQNSGDQVIQRKGLQSELDKELAVWAKDKGYSLDPKNKDYAFALQEYAYDLTHEGGSAHPTEKPKKKADIKKWETKFKKASLLAKMIMKASKVEQKEERAGLIGQDLATVGFINEAMDAAALLTKKEEKGYIYEHVLKSAGKASATQLTTVIRFFTDGEDISDNPVIDKLEAGDGNFSKTLGNTKLTAVLDVLVDAYKSEARLVEVLSKVLVFNSGFRNTFSKWMWGKDKDLLFKVVDSEYFVEPGYGGSAFANSAGNARELTMKDDMPWVYSVKQKYYVDYLVGLGTKAAVDIKKPKNLKFAALKKWLDTNTEKISEALNKLYAADPEKITDVYQHITDIFFHHVDRGDVTPDLSGKLGKLGASHPSKMRLKSDCDVLATYAVRLLKGSGFSPVGYMAIQPDIGVGHAAALLEKGGDYYIVNNKEVTTVSAKSKAEAVVKLRNDVLLVWDETPESYEVFYADAEADGAMPKALALTEALTQRKDLEPSP